jgi:ATP-binding cassette subfamily C protein LapB
VAPNGDNPRHGPDCPYGRCRRPGAHLARLAARGLAPARQGFREAFAISLFVNLLALALPIFILQVYDRVVFHAGLSTLVALLVGVVLALIFDFTLRQARSRILQRVALRIDVAIGRRLFDKLTSLPLRTLEGRPAGYWQSLFRDAEVVRNVFSGPTAVLVTDLPFALIFFGLIWIIAGPVIWVLLVALPLFVLLALLSGRTLDSATRSERSAGQNRDAYVAEMLQSRTTIKALALEGSFRPGWEGRHAASIEQATHRGGWNDSFGNIGIGLSLLTTVAIVSAGALAIIDQQLTIGSLIAATMLSNRIIQPLNQLVNTWRAYAGYRQAVHRLNELFGSVSDRETSAVRPDAPKGELVFEQVTFSYADDGPPVIDSLGLRIEPPGMLGIVGPNGSGKTTVLKLMLGLYPPNEGRVLLDGADIAQFSRAEIAGWIGYVPQDGTLFSGTVRDNIAITRPDADDEAVLAAAALAGVHDYVVDMPEGYATPVGEAGMRLSGGQRQRIAIARALLPDPRILLLDEAGANLDMTAENELKETLATLAKDHTIVLVTHSPNLLSVCNNIMVLERGRIATGGPTKDVLPKLLGRAPAAGAPPAATAAAAPTASDKAEPGQAASGKSTPGDDGPKEAS